MSNRHTSHTTLRWLGSLLCGLVFMVAAETIAGPSGPGRLAPTGGFVDVEHGGPCAQLVYLNPNQVRWLTDAIHADQFAYFCTPDAGFNCGEYSSYLGSTGALSESSEGFYCKFTPKRSNEG